MPAPIARRGLIREMWSTVDMYHVLTYVEFEPRPDSRGWPSLYLRNAISRGVHSVRFE